MRFREDHGEGYQEAGTILTTAESPEAFVREHAGGFEVSVTEWCRATDVCLLSATANRAADALKALASLDMIAQTPVVSDLLAAIFEAGYQLSEMKKS